MIRYKYICQISKEEIILKKVKAIITGKYGNNDISSCKGCCLITEPCEEFLKICSKGYIFLRVDNV